MPNFYYRAKKGPTETIEGKIEAETEKEALEKISALGLMPLRITEETGLSSKTKIEPPSYFGFSSRIRSKDITVFSRQLASLLKAGVPILKSLNVISEQTDNRLLKVVLHRIGEAVKEGNTFSSALNLYPRFFSSLYIAMVKTGEDSGNLPEVLVRIADYRSRQEEALSRLRMALAYPLLMVLVGIGTVVFMLTFVMPRLAQIFLGLGQRLPLPTRILLGVSHYLSNKWFWLGVLFISAFLIRQLRSESFRVVLDKIKLRLPVFGRIILKAELARFSRTMELLLKSGIPILRAIAVAYPVVNNEILKDKLKSSLKDLEQGGFFAVSLKQSQVFPAFMTNLISVGEESGKLAEAFAEVANSYEQDTQEAISLMTNLLEPVLILVLGLIVGFIVISMLLPIFEINVAVR